MEKVMLSKEEAKALESALEVNGGDKANVVHWHARELWSNEREVLNDLDLDTVCRALYEGYEIEPSPEEKIKTYYDATPKGYTTAVIEDVLNLLNIQIQGINC
jgi:hypothetical protein